MKNKDLFGIEIIISKNLNKDKVKRWFEKNFKRLKIHRTEPVFDYIFIDKNPKYKIWNPKKPFKGKNDKYILLGITKELYNLKLKNENTK